MDQKITPKDAFKQAKSHLIFQIKENSGTQSFSGALGIEQSEDAAEMYAEKSVKILKSSILVEKRTDLCLLFLEHSESLGELLLLIYGYYHHRAEFEKEVDSPLALLKKLLKV